MERKFSWESYHKLRKLLNLRNANHSNENSGIKIEDAFNSTKHSENSGTGGKGNGNSYSGTLGIPCEVVLTFQKIGTTGKYCSIRHMKYSEFETGIFGRMESALSAKMCLRDKVPATEKGIF